MTREEYAQKLGKDCWTVTEFARQAGLSKARIYQIWKTGGEGPPRVVTYPPGRRFPTICVPVKAGTEWINRRYGGPAT